jgi:hypothetical protein
MLQQVLQIRDPLTNGSGSPTVLQTRRYQYLKIYFNKKKYNYLERGSEVRSHLSRGHTGA